MFDLAVGFLALAAIVAYIHRRFIGLPTTIGVKAIVLVASLALIGLPPHS